LRTSGTCAIVIHGKGLSPTLSDPPAGGLTLTQRNTTMASMKKKKKGKKAEKKPS
jgi:hypothetical protein